jgi:predicted DNA-binding transcriptional regulator YafY
MRADRLLAMLMLLQTRERMTARELAAELEVSERTIYRDISALGTAGVPICAERGPGGGVWLIERYRSDLTGLNKDEVQALFMLSIPPALSDLGLDQELKAALLKLSAALPSSLRVDKDRVRQRIHIDPQPWKGQREGPLPHLQAVQQAVWNDRVVFVRYYSVVGQWIGPLEADIHPYGLVARGGNWYLVGYRRDHIAVLRVDYLLDARVTDRACKRPEDFNLVEYWDQWCRESSENRPCFPVIARVSPGVTPSLPKLFGEGILEQIGGKEQPDSEGWVTLELPFEYHEQALETILPFGGAVEVLEPIALRASIQDYADQILGVYSKKRE